MSAKIIDASALLALINGEPGAPKVAAALPGAAISTVNLTEVATRLIDRGMPGPAAWSVAGGFGLDVVAFDEAQAQAATLLRTVTRSAGLSLGDRACLALASSRRESAVTADRAWATLNAGVTVELIR